MIIRSQDKKVIVNLNNIDSICIEHNVCEFDVVCYNGLQDSKLKISAYSTEEKAIKVLDMIQDAYERCESTKALTSGTIFEIARKCNQEQAEDFKKEHRATLVFQMPSDEEVGGVNHDR